MEISVINVCERERENERQFQIKFISTENLLEIVINYFLLYIIFILINAPDFYWT